MENCACAMASKALVRCKTVTVKAFVETKSIGLGWLCLVPWHLSRSSLSREEDC